MLLIIYIKYLPMKNLSLKGVKIKAFGSTDIGISFLVSVDGVDIFHAGDLNWWHWWDEDGMSVIKMQIKCLNLK